ncbi:ATP-dependent exoDNAse (exonuclease V) beta subunit [Maribacter vaceletii]|uniref:DNA 3'-5' helicase n=1 Tax=Maribacter vaceletii TaxID=1206816 RepID=A0A495EDF0_9FLAO|nr:UvrD-helicase domain-containing protein [Maribacter vaceletii]RKR14930.1 ATP-dependent exoDNAse (exonuclease V) beta subunit [Maribacter vaceletii]
MQEASYKIYNASAGSGKTYVLSKEYIKTILSSTHSFKQILAITFTNKAVNEMKQRIVQSLFEFSKTKSINEASAMFLDIMKELKIDAATLQEKSKKVLKNILHNYAFFDISTIDKFTHRLIRTFAKDLKLPQNFEVVLDTSLLLDEAVSSLINKAGSNKKLTKVLLDFAIEKIDDDKSWDIAIDLNKIGKLLFNENQAKHLEALKSKSLDDFLKLKKDLVQEISKIEADVKDVAKNTLLLIQESGFEFSDFPRATLPNHFKKIGEDIFEPNKLYNNKLEQNLMDNEIVKKTISKPTEELSKQLLECYIAIKKLLYSRAFYKNAYKNLVPLTVLNAIQQEVKNIQKEKDQLSISEFNTIISNEIKNQPAPFIYERLGEKYRHYFVDEFQDTSEMQWNNLTPLMSNALESEDLSGKTGSLFLVGDAKQAIYRWRGGKAEQFLNLANNKTNPFVIPPNINSLPNNYRSYEEIIEFNNSFFTTTSPFLNNNSYKDLFIEGNKQGSNTKKGGLVSLTFLEEENSDDENYCEKVLETIHNVKKEGYNYKDICIITRKKKHGILIANFLMQHKIPIVSSESLLLKNSPKVLFLISLLKYNLQPDDLENNYLLLQFLSQDKKNKHNYIASNINAIQELFNTNFNYNTSQIEQASVFDTVEYAIKQFNLAENSDAYINYFLDVVLEVEQQNSADLQTFLNYWTKKEDSLSISAPETMNAVQIMTVHKSKGLEFNIVIFPFATTNFNEEIDPKLWLPNTLKTSENFKELLVSKKQEVINYNTTAEYLYNNEEQKLELDAFNVLYVALTRAVKALYIYTKKELNKSGSYKKTSYAGMFIDYLTQNNLWNLDTLEYTFGTLPDTKEKDNTNTLNSIPYIYTEKDRPSFNIITTSGMLWNTSREDAINTGNLYHNILSNIKNKEDINSAVNKAITVGEINNEDVEVITSKLKEIISHPELKEFYQGTIIVNNEKEIITKEGKLLRPDRVIINNKEATVIDYKTGKKNPRYYQQVYEYCDALKDMGFQIKNKIIIYINKKIEIEYI